MARYSPYTREKRGAWEYVSQEFRIYDNDAKDNFNAIISNIDEYNRKQAKRGPKYPRIIYHSPGKRSNVSANVGLVNPRENVLAHLITPPENQKNLNVQTTLDKKELISVIRFWKVDPFVPSVTTWHTNFHPRSTPQGQLVVINLGPENVIDGVAQPNSVRGWKGWFALGK